MLCFNTKEVGDLNLENLRMKEEVRNLAPQIINQNEQVRKLEKEIEQVRNEREILIVALFGVNVSTNGLA